jgi:hypothetical protein
LNNERIAPTTTSTGLGPEQKQVVQRSGDGVWVVRSEK